MPGVRLKRLKQPKYWFLLLLATWLIQYKISFKWGVTLLYLEILGHIPRAGRGGMRVNILSSQHSGRGHRANISLNIVSGDKLNSVAYFMVTKLQFLTQLIHSLCFTFRFHFQHIFSLSLASCFIYTCFCKIFLIRSQINVLWIVCVMNCCAFIWLHLFLKEWSHETLSIFWKNAYMKN